MKRVIRLVGLLFAVALSAGCVERRFVVESVPPSAKVYLNGQEVGFAPADIPFIYYGKYRFTFVKDGFQTLDTVVNVRAPWYEIPGLDFISENVVPSMIHDIRRLKFTMQPLQAANPDEVLQKGTGLRQEGQALGGPRPPRPPAPPVRGPVAPIPGQPEVTSPPPARLTAARTLPPAPA